MSGSAASAIKVCQSCKRNYNSEKDFLMKTSGWHYGSDGNLWFTCDCGAKLMLSKGRYDWFSPALFLDPQAQAVMAKMGTLDRLPLIPAGVAELQNVLRDEAATSAQLAAAVKRVPFIAAELLKAANGYKNSEGAPLRSIEHVVIYLGRKAVVDQAQMAAVRTFRFKTIAFDPAAFWREAVLTGKIAEAVARHQARALNPDEAYVAGSLCNIGKVVAAICFPEKTDEVYKLVTASKRLPNWSEAEAQVGAESHAVLGEIGAVYWGLPAYVKEAARFHHQPTDLSPRDPPSLRDVCVLANQMTHWVQLKPNRIEQPVLTAAGKRLGLGEAGLQKLADDMIVANKGLQAISF